MNKLIFYIFLFLTLSCNSDSTDEPEDITKQVTPTFVTTLNPIDSGTGYAISQNVIQGIAAFENGWFVTQKSGNTLLINYLSTTGESLFNLRLAINSHGQDLSLEQISENELNLYTSQGEFSQTKNTGILKLSVQLPEKIEGSRDWSQMIIVIDTQYDLNYSNSTPTLSEDKQKFAIRSGSTVLVHDKQQIENNQFTENYHFQVNASQRTDNNGENMWFQGIAMKNNFIYCLTGNEKLDSHKKIYKYNQEGIAVQKLVFDKTNIAQEIAIKLEPEGLSILGNKLFFTIMTKNELSTGNIKYLYSIDLP